MADGGCIICTILIITLSISVIFITLNFVWLFPVMNDSKKKEPPNEIRQSLILYESNSGIQYDCDYNLISFLDKGAFETFNIKMKQIHKYSTGLISILFIDIGLSVIAFVAIIILTIVKSNSDATVFIYCCQKLLNALCEILNLIFFILLSVYYYKGKYKELEDFSTCYFFDYDRFMDTYDFIFKVQKNYKKVFILNIIFLSLNCCLNLLNICLKEK